MGRLDSYLELAARRNLQNRIQAEARLHAIHARYAGDQPLVVWPDTGGEPSPGALADAADLLSAACKPHELAAGCLWVLAGERRTEPLAAALGLSHLSLVEQRREVKRFKDRLKRRLERLISKWIRRCRAEPEVE